MQKLLKIGGYSLNKESDVERYLRDGWKITHISASQESNKVGCCYIVLEKSEDNDELPSVIGKI